MMELERVDDSPKKEDESTPLHWEELDVSFWLMSIVQLPEYAQLFQENKISGQDLLLMTETKLKEMGVDKIGHRKVILSECLSLRENSFNLKGKTLSADNSAGKTLIAKKKKEKKPSKNSPLPLTPVENSSLTDSDDEALSQSETLTILPNNPQEWSIRDLGMWLDSIGFGIYKQKFAEELIAGDVLFELDFELLSELGMKAMGHIKKFLNHRSKLLSRVPVDVSILNSFPKRESSPVLRKEPSPLKNSHRSSPISSIEDTNQEEDTKKWDVEKVCEWIEKVELKQYSSIFHENGVDGATLLDIDQSDLESMGITILGHKKKILSQIKKLK